MLDDMRPSYAITAHKAQGSQWPMVIVVLAGLAFGPQAHLHRFNARAATGAAGREPGCGAKGCSGATVGESAGGGTGDAVGAWGNNGSLTRWVAREGYLF